MAPQKTRESGHRQLDHTADVALEIWGPSEEAMLAEALRALVGLLTDGAEIATAASRDVEVSALDPGDRVVRWLSEVLYLATVEGFVAADADIELAGAGLRARLRGSDDAQELLRTEIKAVTYHDLAVEHVDGRVVARVVLDV